MRPVAKVALELSETPPSWIGGLGSSLSRKPATASGASVARVSLDSPSQKSIATYQEKEQRLSGAVRGLKTSVLKLSNIVKCSLRTRSVGKRLS